MSGSRGVGISGCRGVGVLGCRDVGNANPRGMAECEKRVKTWSSPFWVGWRPVVHGTPTNAELQCARNEKNMELSILGWLASRCTRDANQRGMAECENREKTWRSPFWVGWRPVVHGTPTNAEWQSARNEIKHGALHSGLVGVPLCTGRQPTRNGRVRETRENMELSIPCGLASRCARDANPRGMAEFGKRGKTC